MKQYIPADPEFYETFKNELSGESPAVIHYFNQENLWVKANVSAEGMTRDKAGGEYLTLESGEKVRIDRIITINGKPAPAFDEYDAYALACLDCQGGMD